MGWPPQLLLFPLLLTNLCKITYSIRTTHHSHSRSEMAIPRIIHQSWKDSTVPERFKRWPASWRQHHPNWEYRLWTDADNRELVETKYPWFMDTFTAMRDNIRRADACRVFYMYEFGGMYADLDFEALRNLDELLEGHSVVLAAMGSDLQTRETVPNAWMASVPRHPFWLFCIQQMIKRVAEDSRDKVFTAEDITGPFMLHASVGLYKQARKRIEDAGGPPSDLTILPPGTIYPIDWRHQHPGWSWFPEQEKGLPAACWVEKPTFDDVECKKAFPNAYAITYWTHSWVEGS